jgi:hypothetical protein
MFDAIMLQHGLSWFLLDINDLCLHPYMEVTKKNSLRRSLHSGCYTTISAAATARQIKTYQSRSKAYSKSSTLNGTTFNQAIVRPD